MTPRQWVLQNHGRKAAFTGIVVALAVFGFSLGDTGLLTAGLASVLIGFILAVVTGLPDRDPPPGP